MSRPQPRRSAFLSHSHFPSDAVPRVPSHPPPTIHPLSRDGAIAARETDSFTFHASSCSEADLGDKSTVQLQAQGECSGYQAMELLTSVARRQDTAPTAVGDGQLFHKNQEVYQPHDHSFLPVFERPQAGTKEYTDCQAASESLPGGQGQGARTIDLTSCSVQMEIIQMRDELKRFHELKLHHKQLEAQLTARMRQGGSETVAEVYEIYYDDDCV